MDFDKPRVYGDTSITDGLVLSSDNTKTFFTISQNLAHLTILKMNQPKKNSTKNHPKKLGILKASLNPPSWNMVTSKLLPVAHFVKGGWSYGYEL